MPCSSELARTPTFAIPCSVCGRAGQVCNPGAATMRPGDQRVSIESQAQRRHPDIRKSGAAPLPIRSARHHATPLADQYAVDRPDVNSGRVRRVDDDGGHGQVLRKSAVVDGGPRHATANQPHVPEVRDAEATHAEPDLVWILRIDSNAADPGDWRDQPRISITGRDGQVAGDVRPVPPTIAADED